MDTNNKEKMKEILGQEESIVLRHHQKDLDTFFKQATSQNNVLNHANCSNMLELYQAKICINQEMRNGRHRS